MRSVRASRESIAGKRPLKFRSVSAADLKESKCASPDLWIGPSQHIIVTTTRREDHGLEKGGFFEKTLIIQEFY